MYGMEQRIKPRSSGGRRRERAIMVLRERE